MFAVPQLVKKAAIKTAWEFLELLLDTVPYRIHKILADDGIQFAEQLTFSPISFRVAHSVRIVSAWAKAISRATQA